MNRGDRTLLVTGVVAALLGIGAGVAELLAGTTGWAGNKNDPTTLGWVTIALALVVGAATVLASRSHRPAATLAAASALLVAGLVGLTTAGLAWVPAALTTLAACVMVVRRPRQAGAWRSVVRDHWAAVLVTLLAVVYLAFGIVARDGVGLLGVAGAALAVAALAVHRRSRLAAALALVLAAVPFAVATAWTVVIPLTAVLMLAIGLPYVLGRTHALPARGGSA